MADINYDDIVDLPGLDNALKQSEEVTNHFFKAFDSNIKMLDKQMSSLLKKIKGFKDDVPGIPPTDPSAPKKLDELEKQLKKLSIQHKNTSEAQAAALKISEALKNGTINLQQAAIVARKEWKNLSDEEKRSGEVQKMHTKIISRASAELSANTKVRREAAKAMKAATGSYNEAIIRLRKLDQQLKNTKGGLKSNSAEVKKLRREYLVTQKQVKSFETQLNQHYRSVGKYAGAIKGAALQMAGMYLGVQGLITISKKFIDVNRNVQESQADVRKTTGLLTTDVLLLTQQLKTIDTKTSINELLSLAQAAGRMNIGSELVKKGQFDEAREEIASFVKVMDKVFVALGDELDGSAEEIATTLAKISSTFGLDVEFGAAEGINKIGSAINELGANTKAQSKFIVDATRRLQAFSKSAGIGAGDVLGMAATLDELALRTESSTTAIQQFNTHIAKDLPKFAEIAGKSLEEFSKIAEEDANEALFLVLEGAQTTSGGLVKLGKVLDKLGIKGKREGETILALSENMDKLRRNQKIANDELERGTSLTNEFNIKNDTLGASLDKLSNAFDNLLISDGAFAKFLKSTVSGLTNLISSVDQYGELEFSKKLEKEKKSLNGLVTAINSTNDNQEVRNALISKLKDEYPSFLKGISDESINNDLLSSKLKEVNKQYVTRIALAKLAEEVNKTQQIEGEALARTIKRERLEGEKLSEINERLGTSFKTVEEAGRELRKQYKEASTFDAIFNKDTRDKADAIDELRRVFIGTSLANKGFELAQKSSVSASKEQADALEILKKKFPEYAAILEDVEEGTDDLETIETKATKTKKSLEQQVKDLSLAYVNGSVSMDTLIAKYKEWEKQLALNEKAEKAVKDARAGGDSSDVQKHTGSVSLEELKFNKLLKDDEVEHFTDSEVLKTRIAEEEAKKRARLAEEAARKEEQRKINLDAAKQASIDIIGGLALNGMEAQDERRRQQVDFELGLLQEQMDAKEITEGQFEARRVAILQKEAEDEKRAAKAKIKINAAVGILKTIANLGLPGAIPSLIAIAATTAVQLNKVNSTPIPQFAKGTESAPKGTIEIGEKGPEIVRKKDGTAFLAKKRQFYDAQGGERIYPASETRSMIENGRDELSEFGSKIEPGVSYGQNKGAGRYADSELNHAHSINYLHRIELANSAGAKIMEEHRKQNDISALRTDIKKLTQTLKDKPVTNIEANEDGFFKYTVRGNTRIRERARVRNSG